MKRIIILAAAALAAHVAFSGYAWYSTEISVILSEIPSEYTKTDTKLFGTFDGDVWRPPIAIYDKTTGEYILMNTSETKVTDYKTLNELGKYDTEKSLNEAVKSSELYILDPEGIQYHVYDDSIMDFYLKYESINVEVVNQEMDNLKAVFEKYKKYVDGQSISLSFDSTEIAKKIKDIDTSLDNAEKEVRNAVESSKRASETINNNLVKVQKTLSRITEDSVNKAQKMINESVKDFNTFIDKLDAACESGEWDDTMFADSMAELTKSEKDLLDAITALRESSSDPDVQDALNVLENQLSVIRSLKTDLGTAIRNRDINAAKGVLASAKNTSFADSRRSVAKTVNKRKTLDSESKVLCKAITAALSLMEKQNEIVARINSLRQAFSEMFITSMDNFHKINAFLCSTNSMEYLNKRNEMGEMGDKKAELADFTTDELARWIKVDIQDPLFRNVKDQAEYESITKMIPKSGYGYYNNIMRLLSSSCFMTYFDLETTDRFDSAYQTSPFLLSGFRGFKEQKDMDYQTGNYTTNWYANKITAPKNWADGETLIVTNGKYKVVNNGLPWTWTGTNFINKVIQLGYDMKIGSSIAEDASATGDGAYYVECLFADKSCTLKKAASRAAIPTSDTTAARMHVGTVSNGEQTDKLFSSPVVYMWWY